MEENIYLKSKIHKESSRFFYIDNLRIICAFFVIILHIGNKYYIEMEVNSFKWKIAYYYIGISRFSVPNFFMISGALFLGKKLSFEIIIKKYIKRIFVHLYLWSTIYSIFGLKSSKIEMKQICLKIIKGHFHLWYLFATCGLYILVPFTEEIIKNKILLNYFIFFNLLFAFVIPNYIVLISYNSKIISDLLIEVSSMINLNTLTIYNFYFIFGYYLNTKNEIKNDLSIIIYLAGLIGLCFTTIISYKISFVKGIKLNYYKPNFLNIFFFSISIFTFFKNHFFTPRIKFIKIIIKKLAKFTFGIYLIHPLITENIIAKLNLFDININIIFLIPLLGLLIFSLSLIICIILDKIPIIGKYLI